MDELYPKNHYKKEPKKRPKHGEKMINYSHDDTYCQLDKYNDAAESDRDRLMFTLQSLFNSLAVIPSLGQEFNNQKKTDAVRGDGSSLHIHASHISHKSTVGNDDDPIYLFSAPDADLKWDSSLDSFYLGFTFYNISYHNPLKNIDLSVFISLEKASRYDPLTSISSTASYSI